MTYQVRSIRKIEKIKFFNFATTVIFQSPTHESGRQFGRFSVVLIGTFNRAQCVSGSRVFPQFWCQFQVSRTQKNLYFLSKNHTKNEDPDLSFIIDFQFYRIIHFQIFYFLLNFQFFQLQFFFFNLSDFHIFTFRKCLILLSLIFNRFYYFSKFLIFNFWQSQSRQNRILTFFPKKNPLNWKEV